MAKQSKPSRALAPIGNYEIGYGKPPTAHQFQPGQPSANPMGRPKGSQTRQKTNRLPVVDIPIHQMGLEEALRPVQVRDGDKVIKVPAYQAGVRATLRNAAKGSNPAMRNAQVIMTQAHQQARIEAEEKIKAALDYKRTATDHLARCKRLGKRFDWEIHPADLHIDVVTGEVFLSGPVTFEERDMLFRQLDALDHTIKMSNQIAQTIRENPRLTNARKRLGLLLLLASKINDSLPLHWQNVIHPETIKLAVLSEA